MMKPRVYRLFRTASTAPSSRRTVTVMVLVATLATGLAVMRVRSRHDVVRLGYQLSKSNEEVRQLREAERKLELERATLTNPARINTLAAAMGMVPAPADSIRLVHPKPPIDPDGEPVVLSEGVAPESTLRLAPAGLAQGARGIP